MMRALDYFEKVNIDIEDKVDKFVKYLPHQFFKETNIFEETILVQNNENSNWFMLPYDNWEVLSFRNGYQDKSTTFDITFDEPNTLDLSSDTTYTQFWYCHYGCKFIVPRFSESYNLLIVTNICRKTYNNLKELPKMEILNIMMNLKQKDSNGLFLGIERFKKLYSDLIAENTLKPEVKLQNQPSRGYIL